MAPNHVPRNRYPQETMSTASLTTAYRPQTFADVAGQETIKAILSRAASEDRIAPAYLFSGTRGVGKTTIARIFAKALNCANAPTAEPCNQCEHCRKITQGMHVDVVEIDGASNRGIDDARRLRESIGYAPMEGRYKVFIIDEAHMLTRDAFNALLKTLEEPPKGVTFVMATTEPHKFPITIVSRCQHYIFKRLGEQELEAHLTRILGLEGRAFEPQAVKLIARRAAGSVRDSMSLMGQVLALGNETLEENAVRSILGLAGQELFFRILEAMRAQDVVAVSSVIREMLDQGVDIGFFLRELATTWRNLFMLRQAGEQALPLLDLPEEEARQWLAMAPQFELAHVHACWQLTLEGQRRVLTSLEPAMALELLLLNLTFLPKLLSMEQLSRGKAGAPAGGSSSRPAGSPSGAAQGPRGDAPPPGSRPPFDRAVGAAAHPAAGAPAASYSTAANHPQEVPPVREQDVPRGRASGSAGETRFIPAGIDGDIADRAETAYPEGRLSPAVPEVSPSGKFGGYDDAPPPELPPEFGGPVPSSGPQPSPEESFTSVVEPDSGHLPEPEYVPEPDHLADTDVSADAVEMASRNEGERAAPPRKDWDGFLEFCRQQNGEGGSSVHMLRSAAGELDGSVLRIATISELQYEKLTESGLSALLTARAGEWFGPGTTLDVREPTSRPRTPTEIREEVENHPVAQLLQEELGAALVHTRREGEPGSH